MSSHLAIGAVAAIAALGVARRRRGSRSSVDGPVWLMPKEELFELLAEDFPVGQHPEVLRHTHSGRRGMMIHDLDGMLEVWSDGEGGREISSLELFENLYAALQQAQKYFGRLRFPLTVYRGMHLRPGFSISELDLSRAGEHWTPERRVAQAFATGEHPEGTTFNNGEPVLLEGTIEHPSQIKWRKTFGNFLGYSANLPQYFDPKDPPPWDQHAHDVEMQVTSERVGDVKVSGTFVSAPGSSRRVRWMPGP